MNASAGVQPTARVIAVIGAGLAGRSFAMACAAAGFYVVLEDVMPSKLRNAEVEYADLSLRGGFGELQLASTVEEAVREADIAVDFVPDELESKLEIFSMIDRMAPPKTILCTPSEALSITDLASCVYRPERAVAVRGQLQKGETVRLLHPPLVDALALDTVVGMLTALGIRTEVLSDPDAPMLVKNQTLSRPN
ncbi:MAG: 3-hydroxyacyl-CoA dehydrogenase NAD-binding domain-containing protein [Edaphobacter sp.]|uniref:3-hydroxyacyl-CoA dehydrogenase NAD-binding domain-containing protein n=1 Tax=Edaphobacter sp. TaxID=1934404 RepID=UPI00239163B5|nr:3-hydroxyacyl-CoA dehydrogenase NAD-binding domain-containing protein [Edaphobacter sp.]MDE1177443.1 3-hydroxyacyl-CoA dehydrogenase NAD-binding domain-containing protein [Edaphobacter sp.]